MRFWFAIGLSLAWLSVAGLASAAEHAPRPYEVAGRLGYSSGSLFGVQGFTFIALDAGYHLSPRWSVGPYAEVGFIDTTQGSGSLGSTQTYLGHHYRFGAQGLLQLFPKRLIDPWLGVGVGYAALGLDVHDTLDQGADASGAYRETARGFEWFNGQAGVNLNLSKVLALGAFGRLSLVDYLSQHRPQISGAAAPHESTRDWLSAGAKASLRF